MASNNSSPLPLGDGPGVRAARVWRAGPKALCSPSPGQRPGDEGQRVTGFGPTGQPFDALRIVGPLDRHSHRCHNRPQGVALGWANGRPFGASYCGMAYVFRRKQIHGGALCPIIPTPKSP